VNKFGKVLAAAVLTCAAAGLTACNEKKAEETAPAPATETAPAPAAETPAAAPAESTPPAAAPETKSDAAPAAPSATEPAKPEESAPAAPEAPATTPEPEKKSEAPSPSSTTTGAITEPEKPQQTADATPAPATAPAAAETKPAEAAPAGDIKDRTSPPDPVSELAKSQGFAFTDGRYRNKDGDPQFVVTKDYMVDWGTWNGFRRYHDACHVCHGPNALGSTFAPALADSLKTMDYGTFVATVSGGRTVNRAGTTFVMPSFGEDRNIMCYIGDIYTYIKARAAGAMPPGRPNGREDISDEARKTANECTG
jgi:methanol metabolism-related c-type cytochrome